MFEDGGGGKVDKSKYVYQEQLANWTHEGQTNKVIFIIITNYFKIDFRSRRLVWKRADLN